MGAPLTWSPSPPRRQHPMTYRRCRACQLAGCGRGGPGGPAEREHDRRAAVVPAGHRTRLPSPTECRIRTRTAVTSTTAARLTEVFPGSRRTTRRASRARHAGSCWSKLVTSLFRRGRQISQPGQKASGPRASEVAHSSETLRGLLVQDGRLVVQPVGRPRRGSPPPDAGRPWRPSGHTAPELVFRYRSADANSPPRRQKIIGDLKLFEPITMCALVTLRHRGER